MNTSKGLMLERMKGGWEEGPHLRTHMVIMVEGEGAIMVEIGGVIPYQGDNLLYSRSQSSI